MDEQDRRYHETSFIFPGMNDDEYRALRDDIAANGLLEAIWLHPDGSIIDGRHRHRACLDTETPPRFQTWDGNGSLVAFVVSLNMHRRHLTPSQKAAIAQDVLPKLEAEARERVVEAARTKWGGNISVPFDGQGEARQQAAALLDVNPRYISDAKRIKNDAPDLFEKVKDGEITIPQAKRTMKEQERQEKREQNHALVQQAESPLVAVDGQTFETIVIDPPWDWGDEGDCDQFGRARPTYATMTIDQIAALPVSELATPNAHIYLWITNRSLPKGFALLEGWGFRYITTLTWCKPSFGMGNYFRGSTEHVLFGVRGSLPLLRKDMGTWFEAQRPGAHSAKPDRLFEIVESCSPGPWLEMFSRRQRPGWVAWGAEA